MPRACRFCTAELTESFCDLGMQPPSNAFLPKEALERMERFYPLHAYVCSVCFLVQVEEFETPAEIFSDYAYFSSFSSSWLDRAAAYVEVMCERLSLQENSLVVEIGSNDGYLLQFFKQRGIGVLGIDPAANCARAALQRGVRTHIAFFGTSTAQELLVAGTAADLIVANNVLAHVPNLNDFVAGMALLLAKTGLATVEVPHLLTLIESVQYDTIYHEHFSYFSLSTLAMVFGAHGLQIVEVEELPTHGGSLRLFVRHAGAGVHSARVEALLAREQEAGLQSLETYRKFSDAVITSKLSLWKFLIEAKAARKAVAGYGAAAKGNTLFNYCGIRAEFVSYVVDRNPYKQNRYLPGSHIPVHPVERLFETQPDYVLILPWNIADEITRDLAAIREWGGRFVTPIPQIRFR